MNFLAHIDGKVWAILPSKLNEMRSAAATSKPSEKIEAALSPEPLSSLRYGSINESGVATINVKGVLYNSEGAFDDLIAYYFGGTSYQSLQADIDAVMNNPSVNAVVFKFHSPGGDAFGANETADKIAALTAKKPTVAYAYGYCASAAYFLAAKCGEIVTDAQAWLGSIGVVAGWADYTGFYEQMGIAYEEVVSDNAPYKRLDIRDDKDRAVFMSEINGIESVFIKSVAKGRGVSVDTVKANYGAGAVLAGHLAVKAGLADRTGSFDEVLRKLSSKRKKKMGASQSAEGDFDMGLREKFDTFLVENGFKDASAVSDAEQSDAQRLAAEKEAAERDATEAKRQLAQIKADQIEQAKAQIATDAQTFFESEVEQGRAVPAEKDKFLAAYALAANDDLSNPLSEGSRVDTFKALQLARHSNGLTEEKLDAEGTQILLHGENSEAKKAELLEKTPLGKQTLKLVKDNSKSATAK